MSDGDCWTKTTMGFVEGNCGVQETMRMGVIGKENVDD